MRIAFHLLETKFPNYAAMKVSAYHKSMGDIVEPYLPIFHRIYDKIYAFSIFTFTPKDDVTPDMIVGGTGFDNHTLLPTAIEQSRPDYSLSPDFPHALGFITRGCPNRCPWCFVPEKEGEIHDYRTIDEIVSCGRKSAMLLDNNVLASDFGITQIERIRDIRVAVDFNQGLDARRIDARLAALLAKVRWIRFLRLACDTSSQKEPVEKAVRLLRAAGYSSEIMIYVLIRDDLDDALDRVEFLRSLKVTPFAIPYRDKKNTPPKAIHRHLARWVNRKFIWHSCTFEEYLRRTAPSLSRETSKTQAVVRQSDHG